ncbi:hypothetical protein [Wolbachia pipientis]|uniref:hypothetical protein n=1 Tax=Wolbachia pipientis TaxID=955 RepID=UPI0025A3EEDE|nr:hypothetical protein [Wolbachia pipientis]MDM8335288.1 hypothetical protein [Wolbachia pipientis]
MLNDQLVMRNHVTKEEVVIPRNFNFLKVVKFGSDDYKLTFCNVPGNELFGHKKYDPQYLNVSDEYKFISTLTSASYLVIGHRFLLQKDLLNQAPQIIIKLPYSN